MQRLLAFWWPHCFNRSGNRKAGALGAKIIGSGGGGCMVAMVTQVTKEKVIQAFLKTGVKNAYEISLISNE